MKKIIKTGFVAALILIASTLSVFAYPTATSYNLKIDNFLVYDQNNKLYTDLEQTDEILVNFQLSLNDKTISENAVVYLALYNSQNKLNDIVYDSYTITNSQPANVSLSTEISGDVSKIRMFIFNKDTLAPMTPAINIDGSYESDEYIISPIFSEGAILNPTTQPSIQGVIINDTLLVTETKDIAFEAIIENGWNYAGEYSSFFKGKSGASVISSEGLVKFRYPVKKGDLLNLSDLENIIINCSAKELPKLRITADFPSITKETWVTADLTLEGGSKNFQNSVFSGSIEIKGRGNSSWSYYPKKSYSLKLDKKASLLDIPQTKKYAIISTYGDKSFMRNYIAYKTALGYSGITYSPKCEYVECYFNGAYQGIYLLVERVDIESSKINIPKLDIENTDQNITGGYLFEKDVADKVDKNVDLWFPSPYQANNAEDLFVLKNPDLATKEYLNYLTNHMQLLHNSLMNGSENAYKDYIDTDSWVDYLIHQEISKNIDGNMKSSTFLYKIPDDDKIYMGPLWDFDLAYGNAIAGYDKNNSPYTSGDCPSANTNSGFMVVNSSCPWYNELMTRQEFSDTVKSRYSLYRKTLYTDIFDMIDTQAAYISEKIPNDNYRWGNNTNIKTTTSALKTWLNNRLIWLDSQWLN